MLIDDLLAAVAGDAPVRHVFVGAHLTVVCSRGCGLASTFASSQPHRRMKVRDAGWLVGKRAYDLAQYVRSDNPIEAAIGLATVNSLLAPDERALEPINGADYLAYLGRGRTVALVGHFPFRHEAAGSASASCGSSSSTRRTATIRPRRRRRSSREPTWWGSRRARW